MPQVYGLQPTVANIQFTLDPLNTLGSWNGLCVTSENTEPESFCSESLVQGRVPISEPQLGRILLPLKLTAFAGCVQ